MLDPVAAIGVYERDMRDYGFATVREALSQQRRNTAGGVVSSAVGRTFLRVCDRVPALRDRVFAPRRPVDVEDLVDLPQAGLTS